MAAFDRYVGIDDSGATTPKALRRFAHAREVPVLMAAVDGIAGSEHGKLWGNDIKTGKQTGEQLSVICTVA